MTNLTNLTNLTKLLKICMAKVAKVAKICFALFALFALSAKICTLETFEIFTPNPFSLLINILFHTNILHTNIFHTNIPFHPPGIFIHLVVPFGHFKLTLSFRFMSFEPSLPLGSWISS